MGCAVLDIDFDLVWNKAIPDGFDRLVIRFDRSYRLRWKQGGWMQSTLEGGETALLTAAEREAVLNDPEFDSGAYQSAEG